MKTGWSTFRETAQTGDLLCVHGGQPWDAFIRLVTQAKGETPTYASHVAIVIQGGQWLIEALPLGVAATPAAWDGESRQAVLFRPPDLQPWQQEIIEQKVLKYYGQRYGWLKFAVHLFDAVDPLKLNLMEHMEFRDEYPICSWVAAYAYQAAKVNAPIPNKATPDDLFDHALQHDWEIRWASSEEELEKIKKLKEI